MVKTIDSERPTTELLGAQRWEDEGGQIIAGNDTSPDPIFVRPEPIHARRHVASMRWNERFVIQPVRPGVGMILISQYMQTKPTRK